jgi:hypothetical protein
MTATLTLTRDQILGHRRRVGALDERLPSTRESLERAALAGLQDSMPRAAVLSLHARVDGIGPMAWGDPAFVQLWGPRYSAYVVAAKDRAIFSLGRLPEAEKARRRAFDIADRLDALLEGEPADCRDVGRDLGIHPNAVRYAAPTGRVLIRWDGARQPDVWTVPAPDVAPEEARLELARRFLRVFGPGTPEGFGSWAGIPAKGAFATFAALDDSLMPATTPTGDAWILTRDVAEIRSAPGPAAPARLLPSGDTYYLLQGADRELLVPDAARRRLLWTSRVWPGAVLVEGEIAGTWRRQKGTVTISPWQGLTVNERRAIDAEAMSLPLPEAEEIVVRWEE